MSTDKTWMQIALDLAQQQARHNLEVPIAAVLVADQRQIASGYNQVIRCCDPTAHAEIVLLRRAAQLFNNYRLMNTTMYVTLEPCLMCIGALIHARVKRLVFAAYDPHLNITDSILNTLYKKKINHHLEVIGGILADESSELLKNFFLKRR